MLSPDNPWAAGLWLWISLLIVLPLLGCLAIRDKSRRATRTCRLPNGVKVHCVSTQDVYYLYNEIYNENLYLADSLLLNTGDTVVDVGANVGLFAMWAAEKCGASGCVYSLEPVPPIYEACQANVKENWRRCQEKGFPIATTTVLNKGAGSEDSAATFVTYPRGGGWSTMYPKEQEVGEDMNVFLDNYIAVALHHSWLLLLLAKVACWLKMWRVTHGMYHWMKTLFVRYLMQGAQQLTCPLITISTLIQDYGIRDIHLLKIDVERAEVDVLRGILPHHWPVIHQVAMEVHEDGRRIAEVLKILESAGFDRVTYRQQGALVGTHLYTVYASRSGNGHQGHQEGWKKGLKT